jgi:hypothetical protein
MLLVLWAAHVAATWRQASVFSGDYGVWMHEVERFAHGEVPYRDFQWQFPPLALWVVGSIIRHFGAQLNVFRSATILLSLLILLGFIFYVSALLPRKLIPGTLVAGFLLSVAYAQTQSAPLPEGMYNPGAPLGFLFLLCAILLQFRLWASRRGMDAALLGVFCGLCILTKQDYWLPALYLVVAQWVWCSRANHPNGGRAKLLAAAGFLLTVAAGSAAVIAQAGWAKFRGIPSGFGTVGEYVGRGFPSWERLTTEVVALSVLFLVVLTCLMLAGAIRLRDARGPFAAALVAGLISSGIHVRMSFRIGHQLWTQGAPNLPSDTQTYLMRHAGSNLALLIRSLQWLKLQAMLHFLPAVLPGVVLLVVLVRWKSVGGAEGSRAAVFLLGLCLAARLRRGFEVVDWFHILLELPVYVLVVQLLVREPRARVQAGLQLCLVCLALFGAYSYWFFGIGAFTREGRGVLTATPRGPVYLHGADSRFYNQLRKTLDTLDPSGIRPLFAMGYTGGFDYFLHRRNPSPLTAGFAFSGFSSDVFTAIRKQSPFLLDNPLLLRVPEPAPWLDFSHWDLPMRASPYKRVDYPLFEQIRVGCKERARIPRGQTVYTLYACP